MKEAHKDKIKNIITDTKRLRTKILRLRDNYEERSYSVTRAAYHIEETLEWVENIKL